MDKNKNKFSKQLSRFRGWIQAAATLLTNIHLPNFIKGGIYQGKGKAVCVPGLNCYSCPGAAGACPIGSFQAVVGSSKFRFSYYITGFLILLGVVLLPAIVVNDLGMGDPFFCKYICPQGVLEGAIPLAAVNEGIRSALGPLFNRKLIILIVVVVLSILFYRPFCKWICPLGAFYALMNKVSLLGIKVDEHKCVSCGKCARVCKMDVDVTKTPNHTECIRCGKCITSCPTDAIKFNYGFEMPKKITDGIEKPVNKKINNNRKTED